jgi:hypothetical protein
MGDEICSLVFLVGLVKIGLYIWDNLTLFARRNEKNQQCYILDGVAVANMSLCVGTTATHATVILSAFSERDAAAVNGSQQFFVVRSSRANLFDFLPNSKSLLNNQVLKYISFICKYHFARNEFAPHFVTLEPIIGICKQKYH